MTTDGRPHRLRSTPRRRLNNLLRTQVTPRHRLSMYSAKHWHAQLSQLTGTRRGDEALDTASLDVRPDTLIKWLSDPECNVRRSYRALIHTAYENVAFAPAEPLTDTVKNGQYKTSGLVKTGADERERGNRRAAPLRIDVRTPACTARGRAFYETITTTVHEVGSRESAELGRSRRTPSGTSTSPWSMKWPRTSSSSSRPTLCGASRTASRTGSNPASVCCPAQCQARAGQHRFGQRPGHVPSLPPLACVPAGDRHGGDPDGGS
ncbi:hypothetical protein [Streptomyces sp. NPDC058305]|uniref:hypothetical protein n=1 Tax=Streptomyces sp. NPDC058305 TaxID=3346438 RepID=UPI0036E00DEC